ncbi:MAG: hypothetical protein ACI9R3_001682 [Verrucomicrobiales bacterium]|jgi:hypothetical protein
MKSISIFFWVFSLPLVLGCWLANVPAALGQVTYTVNIDGFSTFQHADTGTVNPYTSPPLAVGSLFDGVGADRTLYLQTDVGHVTQSLDVNSSLFPNFLSLQTAVASTSRMLYDNIGGTEVDLTNLGATHFLFDLQIHDQSGNWVLDVTDGDGDSATYAFTQSAITGPETLAVAFTDFTQTGTMDFDRLTSFQLEIAGDALDYQIGVFGAGTVPEPTTGMLVLLGAGFLLGMRRRVGPIQRSFGVTS